MSTISPCESPIFIIGTERSGSNLLRLILDVHPDVVIPHPPHLMKYFGELDYGNLSELDNLRSLSRDMVKLIETHIFPWEIPLSSETLAKQALEPSHFGLVSTIYECVRSQHGVKRWGCKSTFMIKYITETLSVYPKAQFILLVRDPRDVAVSARKSVFSPCHPYLSATLWNEQQALGRAAESTLNDTQLYTLRYEDLLVDSEMVLRQVCDFLNLEFTPNLLRFFEQKEAKKSANLSESWGNTARPILKNNHQKFHTELSPKDIATVEKLCQDNMQYFGYALVTDQAVLQNLTIGRRNKIGIQSQEALMRLQIEWRSLRHDKNHWRRWKRDATARWFALQHS